MKWYEEAVFYHIYPLGLCGAPQKNEYGQPVHRLKQILPWIDHMKRMGFTALYIGPLFESSGHGYETTDYYRLDSRLGTCSVMPLSPCAWENWDRWSAAAAMMLQ